MKSNEERLEMLRQQVISKVQWGAKRQEVTDWLKEEYRIEGARAEELLHAADCARGKAIREKAFLYLVLSLLGLVMSGAFFYVRILRERMLSGEMSETMAVPRSAAPELAAAGIIATVSLATLLRSVRLLVSGKTTGAVD